MQAHIENMGECALLIHLGEGLDAAVNARVHVLAAALRNACLAGVDDVVPAYASVLVRHHFVDTRAADALHERVLASIQALPENASAPRNKHYKIPVCYGGAYGADLDALASACGLAVPDVIARHCAPEYLVAMTGFAPGFPYLLGLDPRLATPRRATPRQRIPAGSIGIAGAQTGIYPKELPGGWQLIGRTPLHLFDTDNDAHPCLLEPGDRVRFTRIDVNRFDELKTDAER